jgi:hypothetical protein
MNFKAYLLFIFLWVGSIQSIFACRCSQISIADNYKRAGLIFYGKHLETVTLSNAFDAAGKPLTVENFQVIRFYKGIDDAEIKLDTTPYKLSLASTCNKNSCGFCFTSGKFYLVYASQTEGVLGVETELCSRTKEIIQNNFIISGGVDPDAGKDETKELMRLAANDTLSKSIRVDDSKWQENKQTEEDIKRKLQKELKKKNSMGLTLATTTLILFFYVILGWVKKRKS